MSTVIEDRKIDINSQTWQYEGAKRFSNLFYGFRDMVDKYINGSHDEIVDALFKRDSITQYNSVYFDISINFLYFLYGINYVVLREVDRTSDNPEEWFVKPNTTIQISKEFHGRIFIAALKYLYSLPTLENINKALSTIFISTKVYAYMYKANENYEHDDEGKFYSLKLVFDPDGISDEELSLLLTPSGDANNSVKLYDYIPLPVGAPVKPTLPPKRKVFGLNETQEYGQNTGYFAASDSFLVDGCVFES